jgi:hypothetical protein
MKLFHFETWDVSRYRHPGVCLLVGEEEMSIGSLLVPRPPFSSYAIVSPPGSSLIHNAHLMLVVANGDGRAHVLMCITR